MRDVADLLEVQDGNPFRVRAYRDAAGTITTLSEPVSTMRPDDGKVAVERARLEGAADFLVVPATHTFIMNRADVAEQVVRFLGEGRFRHEGAG